MEFDAVKSIEELEALYGQPMELVVKKQKSKLDDFSKKFIELSPFSVLGTSSLKGDMDCSPRGDHPGFIQILNDCTIALPDRPGNNRLDSLRNIVENKHVGLLAIIPGFSECLRINGTAQVVTDASLLAKFEYQGKLPKSVLVISIQEIYFHCAKAITRSKLWSAESQVDRSIMPSLGKILMQQIDPSESEEKVKKVEALIEERVKTTLY